MSKIIGIDLGTTNSVVAIMTEEEVEKLLKVSGDDLSLSSAVGEDGSLELGDTLEQDTVPSVELQLMKSSFEEQIHNLVAELDEKERDVLRMKPVARPRPWWHDVQPTLSMGCGPCR